MTSYHPKDIEHKYCGNCHVYHDKTDLIECRHGWGPWSIVCVHLFHDPTLEWVQIDQDDSKRVDYLCPSCAERFEQIMEECDITDMRPACLTCIDDIRKVFDKNYGS